MVMERFMTDPVAYINVSERTLEWARPTRWETSTVVVMDKVPLYVKKEWVDLTAAEVKILRNASNNDREFAALLIARFKEKNT